MVESTVLTVLMVAEGEIASVHILEGVLTACANRGIAVRKTLLPLLKESDLGSSTLPLFIRCAGPPLGPWLAALRAAQRPYLYYLDDNFWRLDTDTALGRYYGRPAIRRSLGHAISGADAVIVHSPELLPYVAPYTSRAAVVPASFDFQMVESVDPDAGGEVRIGFAGSTPWVNDLEVIEPAIRELLDWDPRIVFEFAGAMPKGVATGPRVRFFEHSSGYKEFLRFQRSRGWAVGLAPLRDTEANRCKTDTKYRDYGACEIAGIYTRMPPYTGSVQDGITGLLVEPDPNAWVDALKDLLSDDARRQAMGQAAYRDVYRRCDVATVAAQWLPHFEKYRARIPFGTVRLPWPFRIGLRPLADRIYSMGLQAGAVYQVEGAAGVARAVRRRLRGG